MNYIPLESQRKNHLKKENLYRLVADRRRRGAIDTHFETVIVIIEI